MALSDEEKATLEALTAKANEPDDDDFDVEIWDENGAGAKVPYRKAKKFLERFGIDPPEVSETSEGETKPTKKSGAKVATDDNVTHAAKYFGSGNRKASLCLAHTGQSGHTRYSNAVARYAKPLTLTMRVGTVNVVRHAGTAWLKASG